MEQAAIRWLCRLLVVATALVPSSGAYAGMITTGQAASFAAAGAERAAVASVLERAEVANELHALGVDADAARARVAALSDEDVRVLSGRIGALPAGGTSFGLALIVAAVVAVFLFSRYR